MRIKCFLLLVMCLCGLSLEAAPLKDTLRREVVAIPYKKGWDPLLNDLWRSYRRTKRDSKKEAILKQIRLFAISKGLPDQVFQADLDLYRLTRNKNYKLRSTEFVETLMDLEENADRFYSVLFVEYFNYDNESVSLKSYLLDNRDELSRTSHKSYLEAVRPSDWFYLSYPRELISNDYEYFLWCYTRGNTGIGELLEDYVKGKYPQEDYIRCRMADKDQLLDLVKELKGSPLEFFPKGRLMAMRIDSLKKAKASSGEYRKLYEELGTFLTDVEKQCESDNVLKYLRASATSDAKRAYESLEARNIYSFLGEDHFYVVCRNISSDIDVEVTGLNSKVVHRDRIKKGPGKFYVPDTLRWKVPELDDGSYFVKFSNGKNKTEVSYDQYCLSSAIVKTLDGNEIFATDYVTGRPVDNLGLQTVRYKRHIDVKDKDLVPAQRQSDGFFKIPENFKGPRKGYVYAVSKCSDGKSRRTSKFDLFGDSKKKHETETLGTQVMFFTDKGAYRPKDSLKFKIIALDGNPYEYYRVCPSGKNIVVVLLDADNEEVERIDLATNNFGSASGAFLLPEDRKTGSWIVEFREDGKKISSSRVRVDEFSLPSFEMTFDTDRKLYFPGDTLIVRGKLLTYSGLPVTDADISATIIVSDWANDTLGVRNVTLMDGGAFCIQYPTDDDDKGRFDFCFKVTAGNGETREFRTTVPVFARFRLKVSLEEKGQADFRLFNSFDGQSFDSYTVPRGVISTDTATFLVEAVGADGKKVEMPYTYSLMTIAGDTLASGKDSCGLRKVLDLAPYPDGLYVFSVTAMRLSEIWEGEEVFISDHIEYHILKMKDSSTLASGVESFFDPGQNEIAEGHDIKIRLGASGGQIWIAAMLFDNQSSLSRQIISLEGLGTSSVKEITIPYPADYPDVVKLHLLYFRGGKSMEYVQNYRRPKNTLALKIESFEFNESLSPSKKYTYKFTLPSKQAAEALVSVFDRSVDVFGMNSWSTLSLLTRYPQSFVHIREGRGAFTPASVLNDVVVVGYGTARKTDYNHGRDSFVKALQGRVAGISVGSAEVKRIRGVGSVSDSSEPLYVIDGVPVSSLEFAKLAPAQIQSVSIVKDASSTAIYGSRAANGVVYITTGKMGLSGIPAESLPDFSKISQRSDFKDVLTFQPHIESRNGEISFSFNTSDKLSSYHLYLFAHTKDMHNGFFSRDLTVSIPLQVSMQAPRYLYRSDQYCMSATASAKPSADSASYTGKAYLLSYKGSVSKLSNADPITSYSEELNLKAGTSESFASQMIDIPSGVDTLGIKAVFQSDDFSDAYLANIPVLDNAQTITEAHSAVLLSGADNQEAIRRLRYSFSTVSSEGAEIKQETVSDILQRYVKAGMESRGEDVISKLDALCFAKMSRSPEADSSILNTDSDTLWNEVMAFRDSTGGFSWMKEMNTNQTITAAVLERFAYLRSIGCDIPDMSPTVRYLDSNQFAVAWPWWCGGLSEEQYMYVRSFYSEIMFSDGFGKNDRSERKTFRSNLSAFRKFARSYLSPSYKDDFPNYLTFEKARRIRTVQNLLSSDKGMALGKSWGENLFATAKFNKSVEDDVLDLIDYAQHHQDGGMYYPNAVMPFKGMLENEAFAHSLISDVLSAYSSQDKKRKETARAAEIADQVRLWLLLQAQTQKWSDNIYFLNAVRSINDASDSIRQTSVLTLSKTEKLPFADIKSSGNGFTIERVFLRDGVELKDGDAIHRGEKICAEYRIWSKENRSFVKVTAPREACLMPVEQLSGKYYGLKPLVLDNWYRFTPSAYRCVRKDRTEYYFDVFAEESCTIREEFYVVQNGRFSAPVVEVESSYVPAYRANGKFTGSLSVETE